MPLPTQNEESAVSALTAYQTAKTVIACGAGLHETLAKRLRELAGQQRRRGQNGLAKQLEAMAALEANAGAMERGVIQELEAGWQRAFPPAER